MFNLPKYSLYGLSGLILGVGTGGSAGWMAEWLNEEFYNQEKESILNNEETLEQKKEGINSDQKTRDIEVPDQNSEEEIPSLSENANCGKNIWIHAKRSESNEKGHNFENYSKCIGQRPALMWIQIKVKWHCGIWNSIPADIQSLNNGSYTACEKNLWSNPGPHIYDLTL